MRESTGTVTFTDDYRRAAWLSGSEQDSPKGRQPIRRSGRTQATDPTLEPPQKPRRQGQAGATAHILPADSVSAFSRTGRLQVGAQNFQLCALGTVRQLALIEGI
jgi:hypothetical protein